MTRLITQLRLFAAGGVLLAIPAAFYSVNFNQIWFQFLATFLSLLVKLLLGADVTSTGTTA